MAETREIKTSAEESEHVLLERPVNGALTCQICLLEVAKYTCPRCNVGYCSVTCYQNEKHANCSESFYKDWVVGELKELTNSSEDKKKVLEMLTKEMEEREDEETDTGPEDDLAERLSGLDLDKDVSTVWGLLTPKEKEEFARMLQDGRLATLIELWTPWWQHKENCKLVKDEESSRAVKNFTKMPDILEDIPDIKSLLKNSVPSSDCRFDLVNILFSYAFVTRVHNGNYTECALDSTQDVLDTSAALSSQSHCGSVGEAVQMALDAVAKREKNLSDVNMNFNLSVLNDVQTLISGPGSQGHSLTFMSAVLSDLLSLLRMTLSMLKKELKSSSKEGVRSDLKEFKTKVFKAEKKLVFLLSWLQRYGMALHQLLPLLKFEIESREMAVEEVQDIKAAVEENMGTLKPVPDIKAKEEPSDGHVSKCKIVELS